VKVSSFGNIGAPYDGNETIIIFSDEDESKLREELGEKYNELNAMKNDMIRNLKRVADQIKISKLLPISIQHPYEYT
jgi:hypothetical protein